MRRTVLFLLLALGVAGQSLAQTGQENKDLNSILGYLQRAMLFNKAAPQEKVYLHFDNTGYFRGETIRFKAYVTRTDKSCRSDISKVLYVELVNPIGDVCERRTLRVENGEADGDILLDSIVGVSGFYEVRAFTRYMTNWGTPAVFSRVFPIFNRPKKEGDYSKPELDKVSSRHRLPNTRVDEDGKTVESTTALNLRIVRFYPEGGDRVKGLTGRVAFTVTDDQGFRRQVDGYLLDEARREIGSVSTDATGRGVFEVTGDSKARYVQIPDGKGKNREYELPEAKDEGCTMVLNTMDDGVVEATLRSSASLQGRLLGYAIIHNGTIVQCDTMVAEPTLIMEFDKSKLPEGVNQITVFNSSGQILSERLFFLYPKTSVSDSILVTTDQRSLSPCGKVSVDIQTAPNSSVSFSAMDAATVVNGHEGNMKTWMLLSSEVSGYIDSPDYYFEADDAEHRRAADMLMLTQGWRRYDWTLMSGQHKLDKVEPVEDGLYMFGRVWNRSKKQTVPDVDLTAYLYNRSGESMSGRARTDSVGRYSFQLPDCFGDWSVQIVSKQDGEAMNSIVSIDRDFSPAMRVISPYEMRTLPVGESDFFKTTDTGDDGEEFVSITKKTHVLPTVKIRTRRILGDDYVTWFDEKQAQRVASVYYDCDVYADQIADRGESIPTFDDWLKSKNSLVDGKSDPGLEDMVYVKATTGGVSDGTEGKIYRIESDIQKEEIYNTAENKPIICYDDGLTYDRRPIVWIVNNMFCTITNFHATKFTFLRTNNNTGVISRPHYLDEAKSVFFTEDVSVLYQYIESSDILALNPVIAFVYTHPLFYSKAKGVRKSHFSGYNKPTKFEMEDYSVLPPTEDFRRTLYWDANVRTGADGKARVEFYNNSSAKQLFISAEGITPEGRYLISE